MKRCTATAVAGLLASVAHTAAPAHDARALETVSGSRIAVISDGDFLASTYADARLAPHGAHADVLTIYTRRDGGLVKSSIAASNSVTAAPEILAASPDGRTYYVADRLGRTAPQTRTMCELAPGRTLTAIRADEAGTLSVLATREIPAGSEALAVSPDGRWLAIVGNDPSRSTLALVPLRDDEPQTPVVVDAGDAGLVGTGKGPRNGLTLTNVQWRPDGKAIAVNDTTGDRIAFFHFKDGEQPAVMPWGAPVTTGPDPFVGRFTPDGRFYLTSEWGRNFAATDLNGRVPTTDGTLGITRLDEAGAHARIGEIRTGNAPEGLAISSDGRLVATVNMRSTAFPPSVPRHTREASVALVAFDPQSGQARKLGETFFEGVLPEGAAFDATNDHLLVTVFQGHEGQADQAGLAIFRVDRSGPEPRLVPAGRQATPHGAHHVVVMP